MSADSKKIEESLEKEKEKQNQPEVLVANRWKGKTSRLYMNDFLFLHEALYNAAVNLDVAGVAELIRKGADPNRAIISFTGPRYLQEPSFKVFIKEEGEDYPDFPLERDHYNVVSDVITWEFLVHSNDNNIIYEKLNTGKNKKLNKEKEEILILLLRGGAIPSRCIRRNVVRLGYDSILFTSSPYGNLSTILMKEIRCIAEVSYFSKTLDAGIQNLLLYEDCANKASNFYTTFGIPNTLQHCRNIVKHNNAGFLEEMIKGHEDILKKWRETVLHPIQERMQNAVVKNVFEPYTSIKSELGFKLQMPTTILCIITNYLDTSLNRKFHNVFTQMHRLRFDAVEESPKKTLTISWNKFHAVGESDLLLNHKKNAKGNGAESDKDENENNRAAKIDKGGKIKI